MKKIVILSAALLAIIFCACNTKPVSSTNNSIQSVDTTKLMAGATYYQCEMNPEILSDSAGTCSVCGMDLEKKIKQ